MIIDRYVQRNIYLGTFAALVVLVSLGLFFQFVRELDEIGEGSYDFVRVLQYIALRVPDNVVQFMPLATLLGSMLSLGVLAGNSEFIAMQASGVSLRRILVAVLQAAVVLALLHFLLADWVVPDSETGARRLKNEAKQDTAALKLGQGLWLKDESRIIHIGALLPNGYARDVKIFELDSQGRLSLSLSAKSAIPDDLGWQLLGIEQTRIGDEGARSQTLERISYYGSLSPEVLRVLMIEPRHMSSSDLRAYLSFIEENKLDARVENLVLWQKILAPTTIVIMCLMAVPFVLGAQRQSNTGQRLLTGILIGLVYGIVDRLMTQLGTQVAINPLLIAALPNLLFLLLVGFLLVKKQSHGLAAFAGFRQA